MWAFDLVNDQWSLPPDVDLCETCNRRGLGVELRHRAAVPKEPEQTWLKLVPPNPLRIGGLWPMWHTQLTERWNWQPSQVEPSRDQGDMDGHDLNKRTSRRANTFSWCQVQLLQLIWCSDLMSEVKRQQIVYKPACVRSMSTQSFNPGADSTRF